MKCQKCNERQANTHIKQVINGEFKEYDLCSDCAKELGYTNIFGDFNSDFVNDFSSLLGGFFSNALPARSQATRCEVCGTSYADITRNGMIGCSKCYEIFAEQLMPTIRRVHGNTTHCGKHSKFAKTQIKEEPLNKSNLVDELKEQLETAIKNQEFEKAAQLRDKIKEMEG